MANNAFNANGQDEFLYNFPNQQLLGLGNELDLELYVDPTEYNTSSYAPALTDSTTVPWNPNFLWQPSAEQMNAFISQYQAQAPSLRLDTPPAIPGVEFPVTESPLEINNPTSTNMSPISVSPARSPPMKDNVSTKRRLPLLKGGYPCDVIGCTKVCDRNGDLKKHKKRTHTPEEQRAHGCPQCKKRFLWLKDLVRHNRQVHSGHSSSSSSSSSASSRTSSSALIHPAYASMQKLNLKMLACSSRQGRVGSIDEVLSIIMNTIRTRRVAIRLRARRRSSILATAAAEAQEAARRFVMITRDGHNFHAINISRGSANPKALNALLREQLGLSESSAVPLSLAPYALGRGILGADLTPGDLFETIFPGPTATPSTAAGSLQFWLNAPVEGRVVEDVDLF